MTYLHSFVSALVVPGFRFLAEAAEPAAPGVPLMGNSQGVVGLVQESGPVVKAVLLLLLMFSVIAWGIIGLKLVQVRKARVGSAKFLAAFWQGKSLASVYEAFARGPASPMCEAFKAGYKELREMSAALTASAGKETMLTAMETGGLEAVQRALEYTSSREVGRLERSLSFLATTASAAPFIGLFGTVWGIMDAFRRLGHITGAPSIQIVAPAVAEALIATAAGLAAAIPAVLFYNFFVGRIRDLADEMQRFAAEFVNLAQRQILRTAAGGRATATGESGRAERTTTSQRAPSP